MRKKTMIFVAYFWKLSYMITNTSEYDIIKKHGIEQPGVLIRLLTLLILPFLIYIMFYWNHGQSE